MSIGVLHLLSYVAAGGAFLFVLLSLGECLVPSGCWQSCADVV